MIHHTRRFLNKLVPVISSPLLFAACSAEPQSFDSESIATQTAGLENVTGPADLSLTKVAATATVVTGTTIRYELTASNQGSVPASGVEVTDFLPPELTLVGCVGFACSGRPTSPTISFGSLAGTTTASSALIARLSCAVADGTLVVNNANATFALSDPTPADNSASVAITAVNPPPVLSGVSVDTPVLSPPNGEMRTVNVNYTVSDNCPGTVCSLSVASSEGDVAADTQVVDAHTVPLRAKRAGNGPGRVYTIPVTCTDSAGAVSVQSAIVTVPHNR